MGQMEIKAELKEECRLIKTKDGWELAITIEGGNTFKIDISETTIRLFFKLPPP